MLDARPEDMTAPVPNIRDAGPADLPAIAELHATSWRAAYRGLLPDAFLDGPVVANRKAHWAGMIERMAPSDLLLVAEQARVLIGFIAVWTSEPRGCEPGFDLLIDNLHVRPDLRGGRIGEHLMRAVARRLRGRASARACLWLIDGNAPAHRFYRRLGGRDGDRKQDMYSGALVGKTRIIWDDFRLLGG
jgi:ribosomal protein S18 acetylase RimI-like enzyme